MTSWPVCWNISSRHHDTWNFERKTCHMFAKKEKTRKKTSEKEIVLNITRSLVWFSRITPPRDIWLNVRKFPPPARVPDPPPEDCSSVLLFTPESPSLLRFDELGAFRLRGFAKRRVTVNVQSRRGRSAADTLHCSAALPCPAARWCRATVTDLNVLLFTRVLLTCFRRVKRDHHDQEAADHRHWLRHRRRPGAADGAGGSWRPHPGCHLCVREHGGCRRVSERPEGSVSLWARAGELTCSRTFSGPVLNRHVKKHRLCQRHFKNVFSFMLGEKKSRES